MKKIYFPLLFLIFFCVFGYVYGQTDDSGLSTTTENTTVDLSSILSGSGLGNGSDTAITFSYTPTYPGPQQSVTVTASSFQEDLNRINISWYLDGEKKLSGIGKGSFTFTTKSVGSVSTIKMSADTSDFGTITKEISITPTALDILWEADTYVPPFYKGKALPSSQSLVRVIPFPSFSGKNGYYNSKNLIYSWKAGYFGNSNDSGYGKNTFIYKAGYTYNTNQIETTVSTLDTNISVNKKTKIYVSNPKIIFYENKPLEGVRFENALNDTFNFLNNELTVRAVPYYFALPGFDNSTALFSWTMDGKKLEIDPDDKMEYTFGKPKQGNGSFLLGLTLDNVGYDLQTASKNITISYSNQ